jgi:hypothetical protein
MRPRLRPSSHTGHTLLLGLAILLIANLTHRVCEVNHNLEEKSRRPLFVALALTV